MDNAFERARAAYGTGAYDDATLEFLFPQLKESEDEQVRKAMLQHFKNKTKEKWCNIPVKDIISWLEKQKDHFRIVTKMVEQKPAEWSEEDKKMLENIRYALGYAFVNNVIDEQTTDYVTTWINSLRPSWKPSEEQMRAVFDASERNDKLGHVLSTLYNDLKKL